MKLFDFVIASCDRVLQNRKKLTNIFIKILTAKANIEVIRYFSLGSRNQETISGVEWGAVDGRSGRWSPWCDV